MTTPSSQSKPRSVISVIVGWLVNKLWLTFALLIITVAVLFILLRLGLPYIDLYRPDIVNWLEKRYQVDISVERLDASWTGTGPVIIAKNFAVSSEDGQFDSLKASKVKFSVNAISSVIHKGFYTDEIRIEDTDIEVYLDRRLGISFTPIDSKTTTNSGVEIENASQFIINTIFGQNDVNILNSRLRVKTLSGRYFDYKLRQLKIENFGLVHQLSGQLVDSRFGRLELVAELKGDPKEDNSSARVYLSGDDISLSGLPFVVEQFDLPLQSGSLSWHTWADWKNSRWQNAVGDVEVSDIKWKVGKANDNIVPDNIERLSFDWGWQFSNKANGIFAIDNILIDKAVTTNLDDKVASEMSLNSKSSTARVVLPPIRASFKSQADDKINWRLSLRDWPLEPILPYVTLVLPDNEKIDQFVKTAKPTIELNALSLDISRVNGEWIDFELSGAFSDLNYEAFEEFPVLPGLSGEFEINKEGGTLKLAAQQSSLQFGQLFRNPIYAENLSAAVHWQFDENSGILLSINEFSISNEDLQISARANMFSQDGLPEFDLYAEVYNIDASQKSKYLPVGVMSSGLVGYLDRSVESGQIPLVKAVLRGPLKSYPFYNKSKTDGIFSIYGELRDSRFAYLPDWPVATDLDVNMLFEGNGMDLVATAGSSESNSIRSARAVIKDYSIDNTPFDLYLNVDSNDDNGRKFLAKTPLKHIAESLNVLNYSGPLDTKIEMHLGLADSRNMKMLGSVQLPAKGNSISIGKISVDNLDGLIAFDQHGLKNSHLTGSLYQQPLDVKIRGQINDSDPAVTIDFETFLTPQLISTYIGEFWQPYFEGKSKLSGLVLVSPKEDRSISRVHLQSDGLGFKVKLPDGLAKEANNKQELLLSLTLAEDSQARLNFGPIKGLWRWKKSDDIPLRSSMFFVNSTKQLPESLGQGVNVDAQFDRLELDEWWPFYRKVANNYGWTSETNDEQSNSDPSVQSEQNVIARKRPNPGIGSKLEIGKIEIMVGQLINSLLSVENQTFGLTTNQNSELIVSVASKTNNGYLVVKDKEPWVADFKQLTLLTNDYLTSKLKNKERNDEEEGRALNQNEDQTNKKLELVKFWGAELPAVDFSCLLCKLNEKNLGEVRANLRANENELSVSGHLKNGKSFDIDLQASWRQVNDTQQSQLSFTGSSLNFSKLLRQWDYPIAVEESSANMSARMDWPGAPWQIDLLTLNGEAAGSLGKGYLSDVSDSGARLFSLFNIQSLTRKLRLDFKDIYKKGFFFDKLGGSVTLKNGVLSTQNTFIDGNAADVELRGDINLKENTIEQVATVTPKLTSSLPVLVGWAVEPTTGVLVYLLNKLMEPAIDVVTQLDYRIYGSLDDTKVEQIRKARKKVKIDVPNKEETESKNAGEGNEQNGEDKAKDGKSISEKMDVGQSLL